MNDLQGPVGRGMPRLETGDKITGKALYSDDLSRPDMLIGLIVPSTYAHARITGIDVTGALALDGVEAVVTGQDIGANPIGPFIKIGIGGRLAAPPLPHHRAYGSVPRRFDRVNLERRHGVGGDRVSRKSGCAAPVGPPGDWTCARNPSANRRRPPH